MPLYEGCFDKEHRNLKEEFLDAHSFRDKTRKQYASFPSPILLVDAQFSKWKETIRNQKTRLHFIKYQSFLKNRGMSSSGIALKKATVSSLNNYMENVMADADRNYKTFRNFTRGLPTIPKTITYEKVKITYEDYQTMMKALEEDELFRDGLACNCF